MEQVLSIFSGNQTIQKKWLRIYLKILFCTETLNLAYFVIRVDNNNDFKQSFFCKLQKPKKAKPIQWSFKFLSKCFEKISNKTFLQILKKNKKKGTSCIVYNVSLVKRTQVIHLQKKKRNTKKTLCIYVIILCFSSLLIIKQTDIDFLNQENQHRNKQY